MQPRIWFATEVSLFLLKITQTKNVSDTMLTLFCVSPIDTSFILFQSADDGGERSNGREPTISYFGMGQVLEIASITKKSINDDTVFICDFSTVGPKGREMGKVIVPEHVSAQPGFNVPTALICLGEKKSKSSHNNYYQTTVVPCDTMQDMKRKATKLKELKLKELETKMMVKVFGDFECGKVIIVRGKPRRTR